MKKKKTVPGKLTKEQVLSIPELLEKFTTAEIAQKMGVSQPNIIYWLRKLDEKGIKYAKLKSGRRPLL